MDSANTTASAPSATATAATNLAALQTRLSEYDFKLIIDGSGSMEEEDMDGKSRWEYMQESTIALARALNKIDSDGITVCIMSAGSVSVYDNVTADKVKEMFAKHRPSGGTPMHKAILEVLKTGKGSNKKQFISVHTDGLPDNEAAVADVIRDQANSQKTDEECTFLFIQVGRDPKATHYLQQLDDNLKGAKFDIVDAKTIDEVDKFPSVVELIAHAITD